MVLFYILIFAWCKSSPISGAGVATRMNVTNIGWSHAVNSEAKLQAALRDPIVTMLECDVAVGLDVRDNKPSQLILAHPPANSSDLTVERLLRQLQQAGWPKGLKLDFKTADAIRASVPLLNAVAWPQPPWINADVVLGPDADESAWPAAAERQRALADFAANFNTSFVLSVGWVTAVGGSAYTPAHLHSIVQYLLAYPDAHKVVGITYPVRLSRTASSWSSLLALVNNATVQSRFVNAGAATFTFWHAVIDSGLKHNFDFLNQQTDLPNSRFTIDLSGVDLPISGAAHSPLARLPLLCVLLLIAAGLCEIWL